MRARSAGLDAGKVTRALNHDRSIVRTWLMRGTLHVVAAEDVRWLLHLLGPVFAHAAARRHAQLGLDDDLKTRGVAAIRTILAKTGPLTRYELVDQLRNLGGVLAEKTQAAIHLNALAGLMGVVCLGSYRNGGSAFDTYLLGYRRRDPAVSPALQRRLQRGGGWLHPAVVVNGRAVAAWSLRRTGLRGRLTLEPFEALPRTVRVGVDDEVADISRFLGISVQAEVLGPARGRPLPDSADQ